MISIADYFHLFERSVALVTEFDIGQMAASALFGGAHFGSSLFEGPASQIRQEFMNDRGYCVWLICVHQGFNIKLQERSVMRLDHTISETQMNSK